MKHEDELDAELRAVFRSIEAPPPHGFASRTMKAVRRAPLPAGRRPLRHPLTAPFGWAALFACAAAAVVFVLSQPLFGRALGAFLSTGVGIGTGLVASVPSAVVLADVLTTTGFAIARAVATKEATTGLMLLALVGALSLSALRRLLIYKGEAQQWQELS